MPPVDLPDDWNELDDQIYEHRIRQHLGWREVGEAVGLSHEGARKRFHRRMQQVEPSEIESYRNEENMKHDERERRLMHLCKAALAAGEFTAAVQAIRTMDNVSRTRAQLNGLNAVVKLDDVSIEQAEASLDAMLDAYTQGLSDGHDARSAS